MNCELFDMVSVCQQGGTLFMFLLQFLPFRHLCTFVSESLQNLHLYPFLNWVLRTVLAVLTLNVVLVIIVVRSVNVVANFEPQFIHFLSLFLSLIFVNKMFILSEQLYCAVLEVKPKQFGHHVVAVLR